MDFQFELGKTLDTALRKFSSEELAPAYLINTYGTDYEIALETFFALYKRGYIKSVESKEYVRAEAVDIGDHFRITVEGRDYIELHAIWWRRFWFRSIICPIIVSFVTALNADRIFHFFSGATQLLISP